MSFWRTYYHMVWATKNRDPLITDEVEPHLFRYIIHKAHEIEVRIYAINGWNDHMHIVASIPPKISVANVAHRLKGASSNFVRAAQITPPPFEWGRGYGVFTLGESQREIAETYVEKQKEHHAKGTLNSWLERIEPFNEGPQDSGLSGDQWPQPEIDQINENRPQYQVNDPFPF